MLEINSNATGTLAEKKSIFFLLHLSVWTTQLNKLHNDGLILGEIDATIKIHNGW